MIVCLSVVTLGVFQSLHNVLLIMKIFFSVSTIIFFIILIMLDPCIEMDCTYCFKQVKNSFELFI